MKIFPYHFELWLKFGISQIKYCNKFFIKASDFEEPFKLKFNSFYFVSSAWIRFDHIKLHWHHVGNTFTSRAQDAHPTKHLMCFYRRCSLTLVFCCDQFNCTQNSFFSTPIYVVLSLCFRRICLLWYRVLFGCVANTYVCISQYYSISFTIWRTFLDVFVWRNWKSIDFLPRLNFAIQFLVNNALYFRLLYRREGQWRNIFRITAIKR